MKKLFYSLLTIGSLAIFTSCLDSKDDQYDEWRDRNLAFYNEQSQKKAPDGSNYYETVSPLWAAGSQVLMHWHNDRSKTQKNLKPLYNSTTDVVYHVRLITGEPLDSSYLRTAYGDSIYQSRPSQNIEGFAIALTNMHIGDSCTVIIPYPSGYGYSGTSNVKPYTTLIYEMKLKGIPGYEVPVD